MLIGFNVFDILCLVYRDCEVVILVDLQTCEREISGFSASKREDFLKLIYLLMEHCVSCKQPVVHMNSYESLCLVIFVE